MRRRPLCLAVLVGAALLAASPAAAEPPLEIGVQDDGVFAGLPGNGPQPHRVRAGYRAAKAIHARVQRVNLLWKWAARRTATGEAFDFSFYDPVIAAAIAHGLQPQVTLTGPAPAYATADGRVGVFRPDPHAFARFVSAAVRHYRDRVHRWAIWNEPNWPSWLAPTREAPRLYRHLYRAGWRAAKHADSRAFVMFGELAPMGRPEAAIPPLRFLRAVTCRDRALKRTGDCQTLLADGFAHHPYALRWPPWYPGPGRDDVTIGSLDRLRRALSDLARVNALRTPAGRAPELYLTEFGYHANSRTIREPRRSRYSVRSFEMAAREPHVRQLVWYQLLGPPRHGAKRRWDTGLMDANGRPRPILAALREWTGAAARHGRIAGP